MSGIGDSTPEGAGGSTPEEAAGITPEGPGETARQEVGDTGAEPAPDIEAVIAAGMAERRSQTERRSRLVLVVPVVVTVVWLAYVTGSGQWPRVLDRWAAMVTMLFGSFVAGSTPQGGGAVAFPVFTKALAVPAELARTVGLSIQVIGMGAASVSLILRRVPIAWRAVALAGVPALVGFVVGVTVLSDSGEPYLPSTLPGDYVKVLFTVLVVAMAVVTFIGYRAPLRQRRASLGVLSNRARAGIVGVGLLGGVISALTGSGIDVTLFAILVILLGLDARVGVPTSVVVMTLISVVGLATLGFGQGQLNSTLSPDGSDVVAVAGQAVVVGGDDTLDYLGDGGRTASGEPAEAGRFDAFGLWLAGVPAAVWAGLAGAWAASKVNERQLSVFVLVLGLAELASTVIFLSELRSDLLLAATLVIGLVVSVAGLSYAARQRHRMFDLAGLDPDAPLDRSSIDAAPGFERLFEDVEVVTGLGGSGEPEETVDAKEDTGEEPDDADR